MKRTIALLLALMLLVTGCTKPGPSDPSSGGTKVMKEYKTVYHQEFISLNYLWSNSSENIQFAYEIIDGLVEFDNYGVLQPSLATDWTVSDDLLTYTFNIRPGVKWYTTDGEEYGEVTAGDFVDAMKWILTPSNESYLCNMIFSTIKNSKEYYDGEITDFSQVGVKATDKYVLEYTLSAPTPYFIKMISFPAFYPANGEFLEAAGEDFGTSADNLLYCGAYRLSMWEPENMRILDINKDYWNIDILSIDRQNYRYNKEAASISPELFLRGEINDIRDSIGIPSSVVEEWKVDPAKDKYLQENIKTSLSYFMLFDYDPRFEAAYEPEAWKIAVNNINFRKSIYHALDRASAVSTIDPYNPESLLINTMTRPNLVQFGGVDFTMMKGLKAYTETDPYQVDLALEYKAAAMADLEGKVTFPIKIMMPYNTGKSAAVNRMQIIEQQLERALGTDYIDIELVAYPSTDYNNATRSSGNFALMESGWGPDFTDPMAMADVFCRVYAPTMSDRFGRLYLAESENSVNMLGTYEKMMTEAHKEASDIQKRYEMFADAETYLLDNAYVIPFYISGGGYKITKLDMFTGYTGQMGRNGLLKVKGAVILDEPRTPEEYEAAKADYEARRQAALEAAVYN